MKRPDRLTRVQKMLLTKIQVDKSEYGYPIENNNPDLQNLIDHGKIEFQFHSKGAFAKAC
jgi:acyl CoA:acetate/3-ketoacid CoA transferase alpha subunit